MAYEIRYRSIEIPELDSFLAEYDALCKKFGFQIAIDDYDSGGAYAFVERYDGPTGFYFNMDYADKAVPCIAEAYRKADEIRADDEAREKLNAERRIKEQQEAVLRDGIVVGGKRYALIERE